MALEGKQAVIVDSLRKFMRRGAHNHLLNLLRKVRPGDFPALWTKLTEKEQLNLFRGLVPREVELGADFLSHLPPEPAAELLVGLGVEIGARLLEQCPDDDAANILASVPEEFRATLLEGMHRDEAAEVEKLLIYDEETAGRIMTPEVFSLPEQTTIGDAITALQQVGDVELAFYIYVVDDRDHLVGVLSLRQLLLHRPDMHLRELMNTDLIVVRTDTDQEDAARVAMKYDLIAVPVVDDQGRLVGIITIDDLVDVMREEATEDFYRLAGTSEEERHRTGLWASVRSRTPWLAASLVGGIVASVVIGSFEETLKVLPILAAFIPVLLGMGGNIGTQSSTIIVRGLATGRVETANLGRVVAKEMGTATVLGLIYGVVLGLTTFFYWEVSWQTSVAVGVSLLGSMLIAASIGSFVPMILHRVGVDPAVATGPFVTTSVDVLATLLFFSVSVALVLRGG
jgi:magnesium transporter